MTELDYRKIWEEAIPYPDFMATAEKNASLWQGIYKKAKIPDWALDLACEHGTGYRLLTLVEDWCGDASNTVPVLARLGEVADCLSMRVVSRDAYPHVMDRHLTNGTSRSIPIVIVLDDVFGERGHWGPRPTELQAWVMANKDHLPATELYPRVRRWYAKDRGETTLREVLGLLATSGEAPVPATP